MSRGSSSARAGAGCGRREAAVRVLRPEFEAMAPDDIRVLHRHTVVPGHRRVVGGRPFSLGPAGLRKAGAGSTWNRCRFPHSERGPPS